MIELIYIILSALTISVLSLGFVIIISIKEKILNDILVYLVALSAGALIGGAFLHLLPEAIEESENENIFLIILAGFITFYILEKVLHCHHSHKEGHHVHTFHYMSIVGAVIHSFIDGLIIAASFVISIPVGVATFIMVASHEIPKKIGDFGVLVYGGFEKKKAIMINFILSLGVLVGGIVGFIISREIDFTTEYLLPIAAGGFIYVGAADLLPEIRKESDTKKSIIILEIIAVGMMLMWVLKVVFEN